MVLAVWGAVVMKSAASDSNTLNDVQKLIFLEGSLLGDLSVPNAAAWSTVGKHCFPRKLLVVDRHSNEAEQDPQRRYVLIFCLKHLLASEMLR